MSAVRKTVFAAGERFTNAETGSCRHCGAPVLLDRMGCKVAHRVPVCGSFVVGCGSAPSFIEAVAANYMSPDQVLS